MWRSQQEKSQQHDRKKRKMGKPTITQPDLADSICRRDWEGTTKIIRQSPKFLSTDDANDCDGKTPLHLAYQYGASSEVIDLLMRAYPQAEKEKDYFGRTPRELVDQSEQSAFISPENVLMLAVTVADKYPPKASVVCRRDMLIKDLPAAINEEDLDLQKDYSTQILARHSIFETLVEEFSEMLGINDRDLIQKAAIIQALAAPLLSHKDETSIDFRLIDNLGHWYQQEMLKLVMRVYSEIQWDDTSPYPSILEDAEFCLGHLERMKNSKEKIQPKPREEYFKAFRDLVAWLTEGLDSSNKFSVDGPVLKPLESLFNKAYIRRGQVTVRVIGDMVRATIYIDKKEALDKVVAKLKSNFPNIIDKQFQHPDSFDGLVDFLCYIKENLQFIPKSNVLPYRFKRHRTQKKKQDPLLFIFNFFFQMPEYYRVGQSEVFVGCELQIGLTSEFDIHRETHDAYQKNRILWNQPLLSSYESSMNGSQSVASSNKCSQDDLKLIEQVLTGKIATEVLVPCKNGSNNENISFESGPLSLSAGQVKNGPFEEPERLCINNQSLTFYRSGGNAYVVAGPYELGEAQRYFVDSFLFNGVSLFEGTVGLYAHVGPYLVQVACGACRNGKEEKDVVIVESGRHNTYLERVCPIPRGATALEVIVHGKFDAGFAYKKMEVSLKEFDVGRTVKKRSISIDTTPKRRWIWF